MRFILGVGLLVFILLSCVSKNEIGEKDKARSIIDESIHSSGGDKYSSSNISFLFRDKHYNGRFDGGNFELKRSFSDSLGEIEDTYSNENFERLIDGKKIIVADSMASKYEQSINSVFYFALLPNKLNDPAVHSEYMREVNIGEKAYHKIKVGFSEEGGGQDHDDNFIYWINKETNFIDFLAYEYATNGGGMRFRELYNERIVNGIRFTDAINYKPKVRGSVNLEDIDSVFDSGELVELSRIVLENITVQVLEQGQ